MLNVEADLKEIKATLHEALSLNTSAHDSFWKAITEESRQRLEQGMALTLQCRALEADLKSVRQMVLWAAAAGVFILGVVQWLSSTGWFQLAH